MDFYLVQLYRNALSDLSLMKDSATTYFNVRRPEDRSLKEFNAGIAHLIATESYSNSWLEVEMDENDHNDNDNNNTMNIFNINNLINNERGDIGELQQALHAWFNVIWEFYKSVVFEFCCEELSQYPFWTAKVLICTNSVYIPKDSSLFIEFPKLIQSRFQEQGFWGNVQGCLPFFAAASIKNYSHVERIFKEFLGLLTAKMPSIPQTISIGNMNIDINSVNASNLRIQRSVSSLATDMTDAEQDEDSDNDDLNHSHLDESDSNEIQPRNSFTEYILQTTSKLLVDCLSHPLLLVAVHQVVQSQTTFDNSTSISNLATNNHIPIVSKNIILYAATNSWMGMSWNILSTSGIGGFYRGLRSALAVTLIPLSPMLFCGITEMLVYRRMLGHGIATVGRSHSASILHDIVSEGGYNSLLSYAQMTALQVIPGFFTYASMRILYWFIFGTTGQRKHQLRQRDRCLKLFWNKTNKKRSSRRGFSSNHASRGGGSITSGSRGGGIYSNNSNSGNNYNVGGNSIGYNYSNGLISNE